VTARVLTDRELNRALLARQGLLERERAPALGMVERLVAVQAQEPTDPYITLWTRLEGFDPAELSGALERREAVRAGLLRATIHLTTAPDALAIHPITRSVLAGTFRSQFAKTLPGVDVEAVVAAGRELLRAGPRTRAELSQALAPRWPDAPAASLGHAVVLLLDLVQVPPRGLWGARGQARWALTEDWLGEPVPDEGDVEALVLRYLTAFGPAAPADVRNWSRVTGLRAAIDRLRPGLRAFRDERGRELLDVPDGLLPDPRTPAPPRFLAEYDNVALGHDDRSRIIHPAYGSSAWPTGTWLGSVLVDGFVRASWKLHLDGDAARLALDRFADRHGDPPGTRAAVEAEGARLMDLVCPDAPSRRVEWVAVG
jgi:hypothetical protein